MRERVKERSRSSILSELRNAYLARFRIAILVLGVLLTAGLILLALYIQDPEPSMAQVYLNIGAAFITGAVFSLVLPAFLTDPMASSEKELPSQIYEAVSNRFTGLGRVWPVEDTFTREFDMEAIFENRLWDEAVFVGMSLRRFLVLYERIIFSSFRRQPPSKWPTLYFVIPDPEGQFALGHVRTGPEDVLTDIHGTMMKIAAMRQTLAEEFGCKGDEVPLVVQKTKTPIRFGLYYFKGANDILTLYRYGSQSYSNPKMEIVYRQRDSNRITPLAEWIEGYMTLLEKERKTI